MRFKNRREGFSLVEVAIGLMIIGLVSAPMLIEYAAWKNRQIILLTNGNGGTIIAALKKYALNNGCYPVPAPPGVTSTSATAGLESVARTGCVDLTAVQLAAIPVCVANTTVVCKTPCPVGSTQCTGIAPAPVPAPLILIGDVPFATLGLPKQYIIDGFNRKFTYAVPTNLVQASTFADDAGAVKVVDLAGMGPTFVTGPPALSTGTGVTNAHYAIVSHGRDAVGAFSLDGGTLVANCAGVGIDVENCDNNGTFNNGYAPYTDLKGVVQYGRQESSPLGAAHFDDFVYYDTTTSTDVWTKSTASDIVSHSEPGNVLIKMPTSPTGPTSPQAKLDIRGDLAADRLWTGTVCSTSANSFTSPTYTNVKCTTVGAPNAFSPTIIGGTPTNKVQGNTGINCGVGGRTLGGATTPGLDNTMTVGTGVAMTGIANADEQCGGTSINAQATFNIGACPANKYPYGINAGGTLKCANGPTAP